MSGTTDRSMFPLSLSLPVSIKSINKIFLEKEKNEADPYLQVENELQDIPLG